MTDPHLHELLVKTSRTFALAIPTLPEPLREQVTLAYLLLRIADTFEDSASWSEEAKIAALGDFSELLRENDTARIAERARVWADGHPIDHAGYQELLEAVPEVLAAFHALPAEVRAPIVQHVVATNEGMAHTVLRTDDRGSLALTDLADLREYCYLVAGLVGEMLTELYLVGEPSLAPHAALLRKEARWYGEGLQLVNILKDAADDAEEGRVFLPQGVERSDVFALAREDLRAAERYVLELHAGGASRGVLAFNALPLLLAWTTLDRVEREGPGSKLKREEVFGLVARLDQALDRGEVLASEAAARGI